MADKYYYNGVLLPEIPADVLEAMAENCRHLDGVICGGNAAIDQSALTGESIPVEKTPGDRVDAGTICQNGYFQVRVDRVGKDTSLARIIALVEEASSGEIIGSACAFPDETGEIYDIGYCIHRSRWRRGFGMEAVTLLLEELRRMGAKVVTASDSTGWVYDPDGIDVDVLKDVKEVKRARLTEYVKQRPNAQYHEGKGVWTVKCDVALPCATQNELLLDDAKALVANGCMAVCEGANMPTSLDATKFLQESGVLFVPGKAANAGGVATSGLEMSQNSQRLSWSLEEVDEKLRTIMVNIFHNMDDAAKTYGMAGNYVAGANIAGFLSLEFCCGVVCFVLYDRVRSVYE